MGLLDSFTGSLSSPDGQMTPAAQGLLAAGLGILAHNRGLTSGTQALGMGGLEGLNAYAGAKQAQMQQQLQNVQLQQLGFALKKNQLLYNTAANLLGGDPQTAGAPAQPAAGQTDVGGMAAGSGGSGVSMQPNPFSAGSPADASGAPAAPQQQPAPSLAAPAAAPRSALFGNIPNNLAGFGLLTDPNKLFEIAAGQYSPTDLQKQMTAAGIPQGSPEWNATLNAAITKATRIEPTALRPGAPYIGSDGKMHSTPSAAPAGFENVTQDNGQSWSMAPVNNGLNAIRQSTAASSGGKAQYELQDVWDPTANGGKGGMVKQTVSNIADAAGGGAPSSAPAPMRNNNPGALMPGGKMAQYPDMQTGLQALDTNLQGYGKQGVNTIAGVVTKWAPPNENDTGAYIKDVSNRLGIPANQKIDLSNPLVRQSLSTAIALHENGPQGVFGGGVQAQSGAFASAPPMGATSNANAAQQASADVMKNDYAALQSSRQSSPVVLQAYDHLIDLAKRAPKAANGGIGGMIASSGYAPYFSSDAAEYDKTRAFLISTLGKDLGKNNSDAARANLAQMIPEYGKPLQAKLDGLQQGRDQVAMKSLRGSFLTPAFNSGDTKSYTDLANQFDNNVKPSMLPTITNVLGMKPGPDRAAALSAAAKNPQMRSALELLIKGGMLK
jgi:hypothetical protein